MINAEDLVQFTKRKLKDKKLVVATQREPYVHLKSPKGITLQKNAGGVHVLLDGILRQTGGLMVALANGDADHKVVDDKGRIAVPPEDPSYTLKRIFLKKKELDGFYYGFANQTLWPMCHVVFVKPLFSEAWWEDYVAVNQKFADAIIEEMGNQDAFVWVNDYHLALLPKMLKDKRPNWTIGTFWHIPWPTHEILRICPWRKEILEGLAGSDFIGFHRGYHVENFIRCVRRELEVVVDSEPRAIIHHNHQTTLASVPAGIDYHEIQDKLGKAEIDPELVEKDFGFTYTYLAIGVDRIDYTKGIPERLKIIDRFLEKYPEFVGKFVYLSIGAPSRVHIPAYKAVNREIADLIDRINWKYSTNDWQPIRFVNEVIPREKIFAYYRLADVCLVTSLDDGMNLVAKEYAICTTSDTGMLLLSKFTGAAKDMGSSLLINPYNTEESADLLFQSLTMDRDERSKRMQVMKSAVKENNIYDWAIRFIEQTVRMGSVYTKTP